MHRTRVILRRLRDWRAAFDRLSTSSTAQRKALLAIRTVANRQSQVTP